MQNLRHTANKGLVPISPTMAGIKEARLPSHVPEQVGLECDIVVPHAPIPVYHRKVVLRAKESVHCGLNSICLLLTEDVST